MQQQNERSVSAQVPVDEGEGELHEHGRYEREEEREPLPDLVSGGAVRGAEVQRCRGLGREQRHRHKDGTGESHPHSLRHLGNAARCFAQSLHVHNETTESSVGVLEERRRRSSSLSAICEAGGTGSLPSVVPWRDCWGRKKRCALQCALKRQSTRR